MKFNLCLDLKISMQMHWLPWCLKGRPIEEDLILIPLEVKMELVATIEQEEANWIQEVKQKL